MTQAEGIQRGYVDLNEVIEALGINRQTAYNWLRAGTFPIRDFKFGHRYKFLREDFDALLRGELA
jgi:predicted DNA-binding transcriptional regulator AlpA